MMKKPGMVCALDEDYAVCVVEDTQRNGETKPATIHILASSKVSDLFQEVSKKMQYHHDSFWLILRGENAGGDTILNDRKSQTLQMAGLKLRCENKLQLLPEGEKGASAASDESPSLDEATSPGPATISGDYATSPIGPPPPPPPPPPPLPASTSGSGDYNHSSAIIRHEIGYVGLVNQAMTCYLNSLLQALFMTPEFRNALYNWEFDGSHSDESKSIPYQLQKLFLNLQTSQKSAVETTELTRSFGWDSSEAWQQHDIQELCRVMFDALEQKFKNTEQSDLINRLYEGKMIDYVKCLECSTEKIREDTFLDIPLPLRPFGSKTAYGSVEEALSAFVRPEILDGNNQYHCETCNKKCDAHKGLKFSKFPYLLTLHLKRFDFDYSNFHRIKLNDKVSFPEKLNLNGFVVSGATSTGDDASESSPDETIVKCDDSNTTDSGSALDDEGCQGIDSVPVSNSHENHNADFQEDDEGIELCHENERNRQNATNSGPYTYELFSIMIHSGSAAGGHYYAYIKDFRDGEWYCFNDQTVTKITYDDIKKTYGGGPVRNYYSGAYSSSTNAYMLMYRQIDPERNANSMTVEEFPPHIKALHKKLEEEKDLECKMRDWSNRSFMVKVYYHPTENDLVERKMPLPYDTTLRGALETACTVFGLDKTVPIENCRLVSYDWSKDSIECSLEGKEDYPVSELRLSHKTDLLLEVKKDGEEFQIYKPGVVITKVHVVNLETEEVTGPEMVRGNLNQTVREYKEIVAKHLKLPAESLLLINHAIKFLLRPDLTLKEEDFHRNNRVYVVSFSDPEEIQKRDFSRKLREIMDIFSHGLTLYIALPKVDSETLEKLNIPPLEVAQNASASAAAAASASVAAAAASSNSKPSEESSLANHSRGASPNDRDSSPQPLPDPEDESMGPAEPHSDQSASEDSSLTDSERTIVGEAPGDCLAQLSPSNSSVGSDQNVSSPENEGNDHDILPGCSYEIMRFKNNLYDDMRLNWDADVHESAEVASRGGGCYFKATPYTDAVTNQKMLKVLVDERMTQRKFRHRLEPYVGVSMDHFKVHKSEGGDPDDEHFRISELYNDEDRLTVKLGRVLKEGEYNGHVYLLAPESAEPSKFLCEWVIANGASVAQVKKGILAEVNKNCPTEIPFKHCRLRRKTAKKPYRPYLDDSTFDDLTNLWEMYLQVLPGEEPLTSENQRLLFVRQWCPSLLQLKPFQEIVLDTNEVSECKEKISQLSGIPVQYIDIAKVHGPFPCNDLSMLHINEELDWNPSTALLDRGPLNIDGDGHVIYYRDSREKVKPLSAIERKEFLSWENRGKLGSSSVFSYSPRKERALKIYLDTTPPRRREEADVD